MRRTPPGDGGALVINDSEDFGDHAVTREDTPAARHVSNIALAEVRRIWWRQAATGHRLPAERGIIIIDGGAS